MDDSPAARTASSKHEAGPRCQGADREAPLDNKDQPRDIDQPPNKYRQNKATGFALEAEPDVPPDE